MTARSNEVREGFVVKPFLSILAGLDVASNDSFLQFVYMNSDKVVEGFFLIGR